MLKRTRISLFGRKPAEAALPGSRTGLVRDRYLQEADASGFGELCIRERASYIFKLREYERAISNGFPKCRSLAK